jgi:hypothetical protein
MSIIVRSTRSGITIAKPMNAAVTLATSQCRTASSNVSIMSPPTHYGHFLRTGPIWTGSKMAMHYTQNADRARLASDAIGKLVNETATSIPSPSDKVRATARKEQH